MKANKIRIAPSLLAANPLRFEEEIIDAEAAGIDMHHVDVMDGHFVPNLTFGLPLVRALKSIAKVPLDVHVMISNPDQVALDYVAAGADILVFHVEAAVHSHRLLTAIKDRGAMAGIAINPGTSLCALEPLLPYLDTINIMSVNPGFGGQSFIHGTLSRIREVKELIRQAGREDAILIEVDGGLNEKTAPLVRDAGATLLVAGTYFYRANDKQEALKVLRG